MNAKGLPLYGDTSEEEVGIQGQSKKGKQKENPINFLDRCVD
jgi:hypothetical protein